MAPDAPPPRPPSNFAAVLALLASLTAAGMAYLHFFVEDVEIDVMGLSLVAAIFLPWLLPYVKSFKVSGVEVVLRALSEGVAEINRKTEDLIDAKSEPASIGASPEALTRLGETEAKVLRAFAGSDYKFRTISGIAKETALPHATVTQALHALAAEGYVRRAASSRRDDLWLALKQL